MNSNFLKFKRRASGIRIAKSLLAGASAGLLSGGTFLMLSRLAIIAPVPIISLPVGFGVFLVIGIAAYLALGLSDKSLAKRLDKDFSLNERVQTMIENSGEDTGILKLQREDTESVLSKINTRDFKARRLWIYIVALLLGICMLVAAFIVPNKRNVTVIDDPPFKLSNMQRAGLLELISYVENSNMEQRYRGAIVSELETLIGDLEVADRMSEMKIELAESMAYILAITCDSSSSAELLDALWNSGDFYLKHLAKALDASSWKEPDWADFAEKMTEYEKVVLGEDEELPEGTPAPTEEEKKSTLAYVLESSGRKISLAMTLSKIPAEDALRVVLVRLAEADEPGFKGYSLLAPDVPSLTYENAAANVSDTINALADDIYAAVSTNRTNAFVGEYTMTKLSTLFLVPLPEFERPAFVKNNESISDGAGGSSQEGDNENAPSDGGVGDGATFGSKDLVLDPITGKYVEYGTIYGEYYALMLKKIEEGSYTDEQIEMIEKYFALLYSGIKKEDGN